MENLSTDNATSKLLSTLIKLTRSNRGTTIEEVASYSQCSLTQAKKIVATLRLREQDGLIMVSSGDRLKLAIKLAHSRPLEGALPLTWQEFESFTEECLSLAGFQTQGNVKVDGGGRKWQIDVIGYREPLLLGFDCKHWQPPVYLSKFSTAAARQRRAVLYLAEVKNAYTNRRTEPVALSIILTLYDPPQGVHAGSVLLAIDRLPDFLANITPVSTELPFIHCKEANMENSMKEHRLLSDHSP